MQGITRHVWSHRSLSTEKAYSVSDVREDDALDVEDFPALVRAVARIAFHNPELSLFYRGQDEDYRLSSNHQTTLRPSIYRDWGSGTEQGRVMRRRFDDLEEATTLLQAAFAKAQLGSRRRLFQFVEVAWAILQHYEVTPTPLLDVTHSLLVAASFATRGSGSYGHLFVLGLPFPQGSVSFYSELGMLNLRLLSICPPEALRPYFQEGYLAGSFPNRGRAGYTGKLDFGHRLIAKFRLPKGGFWDNHFHAIPDDALYPANDEAKAICEEVKATLAPSSA